ncbi:auxin efflux carrier [Catenaria anguillulae PL171]|uniref:Auxin efflux carrier n=1 Tax=Catenaria anguillulae PL171 TaxID=765915 RepID=A0A1Y2I5B8_9FUNG|nr:auxin efflux carrier [Catenaria anguillulae PL171]
MDSNVLSAAWAGARAMLKVALVCGIGALAYRFQMFDRPTSKTISKMFIQLYLPLLIFSKTSIAITPANAPFLAIISTFALAYFALGHAFGAVLWYFARRYMPIHLQLSLIPAAGFGNNGDLVLSIIMSLEGIGGFTSADVDKGIAYVAVWYAIFNAIFYSASVNCFKADFRRLAKAEEVLEVDVDVGNPGIAIEPATATHVEPSSTTQVVDTTRPDSRTQLNPAQLEATPGLPATHTAILNSASTPSLFTRIRTILAHPFLQSLVFPPNIALFLGLLVALIPALKSLFLPLTTAPLGFAFDAASFLGAAAIPLSMTVFGAALTTIETDRDMLRKHPGLLWCALALLAFRLLALPGIGIALVTVATNGGWIPKDQGMLRFVCMVQACVPTAQICILITQYYHPRGESKEMATIMIVQYAAAMLTLTACLGYIFHVLEATIP